MRLPLFKRFRFHRVMTWLAVVLLAVARPLPASAQSLDSKKPTPLAAGENRGTIDNMVGPQYWSFNFHKGAGKVTVKFTSMGLFGNAQTTTINLIIYGPGGELWNQRAITSNGQQAQIEMPANFQSAGTALLEVHPTGNALVRAGGDYGITLSGPAIDFAPAAAASGQDPVVGTYSVRVCAPDFDCQNDLAIRFAANGTVQTTDGHSGTWKLFDPDSMVYTIVIGSDRWALKLVPGRGLCSTDDSTIIFQAIRPR